MGGYRLNTSCVELPSFYGDKPASWVPCAEVHSAMRETPTEISLIQFEPVAPTLTITIQDELRYLARCVELPSLNRDEWRRGLTGLEGWDASSIHFDLYRSYGRYDFDQDFERGGSKIVLREAKACLVWSIVVDLFAGHQSLCRDQWVIFRFAVGRKAAMGRIVGELDEEAPFSR